MISSSADYMRTSTCTSAAESCTHDVVSRQPSKCLPAYIPALTQRRNQAVQQSKLCRVPCSILLQKLELQQAHECSSVGVIREGLWCIAMDLQPGANGAPIMLNPDRVLPLLGCCHACTRMQRISLQSLQEPRAKEHWFPLDSEQNCLLIETYCKDRCESASQLTHDCFHGKSTASSLYIKIHMHAMNSHTNGHMHIV